MLRGHLPTQGLTTRGHRKKSMHMPRNGQACWPKVSRHHSHHFQSKCMSLYLTSFTSGQGRLSVQQMTRSTDIAQHLLSPW